MNTPIFDFVRSYAASGGARLHMPGHKGRSLLGCEALDITEISGADALYEASGIIAESENNAAKLFRSARTFYSTEGSSQCIRAMLALAVWNAPPGIRPVVAAARNVHKSFLYAAALLDFDVAWLWPDAPSRSICACDVSSDTLEEVLAGLSSPPAAVYVTSPDYLGNQINLPPLARAAHRRGIPLLVDNAHGAYLRFLPQSRHPLDLGADLCCGSAHKTLPVLTGGAYLHVAERAPRSFAGNGKRALELFGSTSPSYLILQSLDLCNRCLAGSYPDRLARTAGELEALRRQLRERGWAVLETDPLKLTIDCAASGWDGFALAQKMRRGGVECEYRDRDYLVLMWTPENPPEDYVRVRDCLGVNTNSPLELPPLPLAKGEQVLTIREALFRPHETVPAGQAEGRVCGAPTVGCPPAVPIAVSGERIGREAVELFYHYGVETVEVVAEQGKGNAVITAP